MCQLQDHRKAESSLIRNRKTEPESSERSKMQRAVGNNNNGAGGDQYSVMEYEAAGK